VDENNTARLRLCPNAAQRRDAIAALQAVFHPLLLHQLLSAAAAAAAVVVVVVTTAAAELTTVNVV